MIKQIFCNHDYEIVKQVAQKSELETLLESGSFSSVKGTGRPACILTIFKCSKCKKVMESLWVME